MRVFRIDKHLTVYAVKQQITIQPIQVKNKATVKPSILILQGILQKKKKMEQELYTIIQKQLKQILIILKPT